MPEAYVDFSRADYQDALKHIPPRFRDLARKYAEEVAARIDSQYEGSPSDIPSVRDVTVGCALNGLSYIRWYLLFKPERAEAAEQAWRDGGVVGLCGYMRELHQSEKTLLVSGYGHAKAADIASRLSALHATENFTLVATSHGFSADLVKPGHGKRSCLIFTSGSTMIATFPRNYPGTTTRSWTSSRHERSVRYLATRLRCAWPTMRSRNECR